MTREDLVGCVEEALKSLGGHGTIVQVCEYVWKIHEDDLRRAGDLFFTWQYDISWAAQKLRDSGILHKAQVSPKGIWELR